MSGDERIQVRHTCATENNCAACNAIDQARAKSPWGRLRELEESNARLRSRLEGERPSRHPMSNSANTEPSVLRMRQVVRERYRAGETAHELALDYGCTTADIGYALAEPEATSPAKGEG